MSYKRGILLITFVVAVGGNVCAHDAHRLEVQKSEGQDENVMHAVRIEGDRPVVDGTLDDAVWRRASVSTDFTQRDPNDGEPPSERTEVRVAYDDEAIYFGIDCLDSKPDSIWAPLTRRDVFAKGERIVINIDARHDHKTGVVFATGPSGWRWDGITHSDGRTDGSWDGVWQAKGVIHERGWSTEIRIPYHVLRFSPKDEHVWGIQFVRDINRNQEHQTWAYWPKDVNGFNSRFGHLVGVKDINPGRSLEMLPFAVGRSSFIPKDDANPDGRELFGTGGVDFRYGLTPGISLNATINPDFGQVEADPAELNLGVFETFFDERRPFFLEGNSIYRYSGPGIVAIDNPARLFHSRRIGRRPTRFGKPDGTDYIDRPDGTTIIGALNLSGKTSSGTSFGIINAVTDEEFALVERTSTDPDTGVESTERFRHKLEPVTNWLVGRIKQDVLENSHVGAFGSTVNGSGFDPAYVGSVDGELNLRKNTIRIFSRITGSRTFDNDGLEQKGHEAALLLKKNGGLVGGEVYVDTRSRDFDTNDLGFMERNDRIQLGAWTWMRIRNPSKLTRRSDFNLNIWRHWNQDKLKIHEGINFNNWHTFHNYMNAGFGLHRVNEVYNDLLTRGGPPVLRPPLWDLFINFGTDDRKTVELDLFPSFSWSDNGASSSQHYGGRIRYRPVPRFTLELNPRYRRNTRFAQWIENVDDDDDGTDDHFVFGELKRQDWDLRTRLTYSFTPDMNIQFWMQQFVTTGDYGTIKELARPNSFEFTPYDGLDENPDFNRRSLRSNLVFRWEYRPGSTFFVVWQQSRSEDFDDDDPMFKPVSGMFDAFGDEGDNIFLVKFSYWMGG
jgi:hypothetical protein